MFTIQTLFRKFYAMIFYFPFSLQFSNDLCVCVCFNDILGKNLVSAKKDWSVRVKVKYTQTKRNMSCFKNLRWKVQIIKLNVSQNLNPEPMHFWLLFTNRRKLCLEVYQKSINTFLIIPLIKKVHLPCHFHVWIGF